MDCINPVLITKNLPVDKYPDGLLVPCGKCYLCRINKRREWSLRLVHESCYHEDKMFLTLTYKDDKIPYNFSLKKTDLQLFFKRLRKATGKKFKYFATGEYGEKNNRPHYHALVFGIGLKEEDKKAVMDCWSYCDWNNYTIRNKSFGMLEVGSIKYVAKYVNKVYSGEYLEEYYYSNGIENVFSMCSNGIGLQYAIQNKEQLLKNGYCSINGIKMSIPRYYVKKLDLPTELINKYSLEKNKDFIKKYIPEANSDVDLYKIDDVIYNIYLNRVKKDIKQKELNVSRNNEIKSNRRI